MLFYGSIKALLRLYAVRSLRQKEGPLEDKSKPVEGKSKLLEDKSKPLEDKSKLVEFFMYE